MDTELSQFVINEMTKAQAETNAGQLNEKEFIILSDLQMPIPTTADVGKVLAYGQNGFEFKDVARNYKHYIQMTIGDKTIYYDFTSTKSSAYTANNLPEMPDNIITAIQVVAGGYYSSVSGLIYRNSENALKATIHGMYTSNGTSWSYLAINGEDATFVSDTVSNL